MITARRIAETARMLTPELRIAAFAPERELETLALPEVARCVSELAHVGGPYAEQAVLLALRAALLAASRQDQAQDSVELVVTAPRGIAVPARATAPVIAEMLRDARTEIVALGYEISDRVVVDNLRAAAERGVDVWLCCDHGKGSAQRLAAEWPRGSPPPKLFCAKLNTDGGPFASMHGKSLLVDGTDALITSANFTHHGLNANVEIGVRLRGRQARELRECARAMLFAGVFEEVKVSVA